MQSQSLTARCCIVAASLVFTAMMIFYYYYEIKCAPNESRAARARAQGQTTDVMFSSDASTRVRSTLHPNAPATRDRLFKKNPMAEYFPSFTTHFCTGGASPEIFGAYASGRRFRKLDWHSRKCVFRNLVWNGSAFRYYVDDRSRYASTWDYERGSGDPLVGDQIDTKHLKALFSDFSGHGNTAIEFARGKIRRRFVRAR